MTVEEKGWQCLRDIKDPELGYSIVDLGLIYDLKLDVLERKVTVTMTFTSPACAFGADLQRQVHDQLFVLPEVDQVEIIITFNPPWSPMRASEEIKLEFALRGIPLTRF